MKSTNQDGDKLAGKSNREKPEQAFYDKGASVCPLMLSVAVERCPFSSSSHQHQVQCNSNNAARCLSEGNLFYR